MIEKALPYLSLLIAIASIYFNNKHIIEIAKREEFRERLSSIIGLIYELEAESVKLHTSPSFEPELASSISWKIQRLSSEIRTINHFANSKMVADKFVKLKKSITMNNFGPSKFNHRDHDSNLIRDIHDATTKLISQLQDIYSSMHKL